MGHGRKQDQRVQILIAHPSKGAVIINGVRYNCLNDAAKALEIDFQEFQRKLLSRKIIVTVPGK